MAYRENLPGRSRTARFIDGRIIAPPMHFEHNSCAVKHHAYTLDSSMKCASALQQKLSFQQRAGIALFLSCRHDKGIAPRTFPATLKSPYH
jgi:hypothetical protein